jgi:flagellar motor switch protein FliN/FliY
MTQSTQPADLPELTSSPGGAPLFSSAQALPFLDQLKVKLTARLGEAELTVEALTALQAGSTVALDRLLDQPIDLLAEGHVVARGTLVAVGDHFGLRITAVPPKA